MTLSTSPPDEAIVKELPNAKTANFTRNAVDI
jgi:hypothetical protein